MDNNKEKEGPKKFSNDVKRHFLEIVSTYNKYQDQMDRKSDITQVAETLGGILDAAQELAVNEAEDWFDKHTVKRNMGELKKLSAQFDKVVVESKNLDQRLGGLYEDMGHILSRYYKLGDINEDEMKSRLGMTNESKLNESKPVKGKKSFYTRDNVGSSKYTINDYDGKATHKDGSPFYGISIFKNKKSYEKKKADLKKQGYIEESVNESKLSLKKYQIGLNALNDIAAILWAEKHPKHKEFGKALDIITRIVNPKEILNLKESFNSELDVIAGESKNFKSFTKSVFKEFKKLPKNKASLKWLEDVYNSKNESVNEENPSDTPKINQMLQDIKNGTGWTTDDYILNAKHSPLETNEKFQLLLKLASLNLLADVDKLTGKEDQLEEIPQEALMTPKDVLAKYKKKNSNESLTVNEGWTDWKQEGSLKKIIDLSKQRKGKTFLVTDDNYSRIGTFWLRNGKFAKQTVANDGYDFQHNKTTLRSKSDVIYKYKMQESINEKFATEKRANTVLKTKDTDKSEVSKVITLVKTRMKNIKKQVGTKELRDEEHRLRNILDSLTKKKSKTESINEVNPKIKMNNLDWGKSTAERNTNLDKYNSLKTDKEKYGFLRKLKNESINEYSKSNASYIGDHNNEYKLAIKLNKRGKSEIEFYDELETLHSKLGHPKFMIWLSKSLRGYKVDMHKDSKIKNKAEAEEALYNLSK